MKSKAAFKTKDFQPMIFTVKKITEKGVGDQVQFHIRFDGKDHWNGNKEDTLDVDTYLPIDEFKKSEEASK